MFTSHKKDWIIFVNKPLWCIIFQSQFQILKSMWEILKRKDFIFLVFKSGTKVKESNFHFMYNLNLIRILATEFTESFVSLQCPLIFYNFLWIGKTLMIYWLIQCVNQYHTEYPRIFCKRWTTFLFYVLERKNFFLIKLLCSLGYKPKIG